MDVTPLPQGFGAEIAGFDIHEARSSADIAALRAAYDRHHLLVFRNCGRIAPERHVEIMQWFGPISPERNAEGNPWTMMDNEEAKGSATLPFHCDITFFEHPLAGLSLHAIELPRESTSTTFVSNAVAWRSLPADIRAQIGDRKGRHSHGTMAVINLYDALLEHWHPIRMTHPRTGETLLFATEHHTDRVEGMSEAEGKALLERLFDELYADTRRYEHVWRPGDLVLWDNLAIQHARTQPAPKASGRRLLQRVAIGKHGFFDQLEAVKRRRDRSLAEAAV